jgi:hypothetical protein
MTTNKKIFYYLYKITNLLNHKIYIGCHQTTNLDDGYMGSGKALLLSQRKYGIDNFSKEILEFFDDTESMLLAEKRIVTKEFIQEDDNYNLAEGGKGGYKGEDCYQSPIRNKKLSDVNMNFATMKTKDGQIIRVNRTDPRFESKELVGHTTGKTSVKDQQGNRFMVPVDDPRLQTGELVGVTKGLSLVKDAKGNIFQVATDDPRIKSGELVGITKGSKQTLESNKKRSETMTGKKMPQPYVKCEYCGKSTSKTNIIRWHKKCEINKSGFDCI